MSIRVQKTIAFNTENENTGAKTIEALGTIINKLSYDDLIGLAELIKSKPGIVQTAKKYKHLF